jgi:hypothetical protein
LAAAVGRIMIKLGMNQWAAQDEHAHCLEGERLR